MLAVKIFLTFLAAATAAEQVRSDVDKQKVSPSCAKGIAPDDNIVLLQNKMQLQPRESTSHSKLMVEAEPAQGEGPCATGPVSTVTVYRGTGNSQDPNVIAEVGFVPRPPYTAEKVSEKVEQAVSADKATKAAKPNQPSAMRSATFKLAQQHQKTKDTGLISTALRFFDAYTSDRFIYKITCEIEEDGHKPLSEVTKINDAAAFKLVGTNLWGIEYKTGRNIEMMFSEIPTSCRSQWKYGSNAIGMPDATDDNWQDLAAYKAES